eukprot:scaffold214857_cov51-Cyclotella_meneghiniana.AAC.1
MSSISVRINLRRVKFKRVKGTQVLTIFDQQTPKTATDKCEEDGNDIHSTGDSTSSLNSNDAADTKRDYLVIDASGETVSGRPKEITHSANSIIRISDDRADKDLDGGKKAIRISQLPTYCRLRFWLVQADHSLLKRMQRKQVDSILFSLKGDANDECIQCHANRQVRE